ncbi:MAG TPA: hypothetical protein DDE71_02075 [Tenacibaculum sp.]|nr:hypothetical protein [Tenacibaculum sp.]
MSNENKRSWLNRNWLWFIPTSGCLGIILFLMLGVGFAFFGISNMINNATPIEDAMEKANNNTRVTSILGAPIEKNGIPNGNISLFNSDGEISFAIPIKGSKGYGILIVNGIKINGKWIFEDLYVKIIETQEKINLIEEALESI